MRRRARRLANQARRLMYAVPVIGEKLWLRNIRRRAAARVPAGTYYHHRDQMTADASRQATAIGEALLPAVREAMARLRDGEGNDS